MTTRSEDWLEGQQAMLAALRRWALDREASGDAVAAGVVIEFLEDLTTGYRILAAELEAENAANARPKLSLVRKDPAP